MLHRHLDGRGLDPHDVIQQTARHGRGKCCERRPLRGRCAESTIKTDRAG